MLAGLFRLNLGAQSVVNCLHLSLCVGGLLAQRLNRVGVFTGFEPLQMVHKVGDLLNLLVYFL